MKKLLLVTGPQGSGNHLYSKLLALHPDVYGWKALNETYWIGHDQEPFNKFWADPSLWTTTDFGHYQYAFTSISVPYVQNGVTVVPNFKQFIAGAESAGWRSRPQKDGPGHRGPSPLVGEKVPQCPCRRCCPSCSALQPAC